VEKVVRELTMSKQDELLAALRARYKDEWVVLVAHLGNSWDPYTSYDIYGPYSEERARNVASKLSEAQVIQLRRSPT
jgi:hypothetical protein